MIQVYSNALTESAFLVTSDVMEVHSVETPPMNGVVIQVSKCFYKLFHLLDNHLTFFSQVVFYLFIGNLIRPLFIYILTFHCCFSEEHFLSGTKC